MSSQFVCWKCGLAVYRWRESWKHASGGGNPRTPRHRRHRPVVIERGEYERAFALDTPPAEARAIAERMKDAR